MIGFNAALFVDSQNKSPSTKNDVSRYVGRGVGLVALKGAEYERPCTSTFLRIEWRKLRKCLRKRLSLEEETRFD